MEYWKKVKQLCDLSDREVTMAQEMDLAPHTLMIWNGWYQVIHFSFWGKFIKTIPVALRIRRMYEG